jgi:two-component system cell cycle sensor histidine kinase/response regulator CckA
MSVNAPTIPEPLPNLSARGIRLLFAALFIATAAIWFFSRSLLSTNFLPHWYCFVGNTRLLWTNVLADLFIGLSYVVISATLVWLVHRAGKELPYSGFFWAFGLFIVSCGVTHFFEIVTVWKPVYWLSAAAKVVTAAASVGTAVVLLVAADDIVAFVRIARESAERRGDERFRSLIQASPLAVLAFDPETRITSWNSAAVRIFGWEEAEVIGAPSPLTPPDRKEEHAALLAKTLAGEVTISSETACLTRSARILPVAVSIAAVYDDGGQLSGGMAMFEDITERKRIEVELREKTLMLSTVTQALNTFLDTGDWSAASRHLLAFALSQTQSQYGFLGVALEENVLRVLAHDGIVWDMHLNRTMYEEKIRQHATDGYFEVPAVHNLLGEVISKGKTVVANSPGTDPRSGGLPAGHPPMYSFLGVPIFKGKETVGLIGIANRPGGYTGQELGYLETMSQATGVLYDSYRQNLKRSALEGQQEKLEAQMRQSQKMEVLGRLAGGVAHDFNNMLMVLGGCSELLDRSLPKESAARIYLDQIQRTTEKAAAITKQLLAFSRKQVLEFRPMDLHEALTESEFMLPRLLGSDVELTFHHDAKHSWILCDSAQVEQVVANLAINARDAMPEGGRLTISTRDAAQPPDGTADVASASGPWVVLEVADTGIGMDEKIRAQIFEPFFTTKPGGKGTGLGLATVYGIVNQSHGHIRVDSTLGEGTRFELYFPAIEAPPSAVSVPAPSQFFGESGAGATILIADDQAALRHAVVEILRTTGYKVLEAESSTEALEMARQHPGKIDVLLTDIVMPGMRGQELARRVAKVHPEVQVVYMSGYAEGFPEAQLPENSVFLQKPFRFATLLEQLRLVRNRA